MRSTISIVRLCSWVVVPLLSIGLTGCPCATPIDVTVDNIEITQATQNSTNSIKLIAERSTAVRVTLGMSGTTCPTSVTGELHVFVNGTEITPAAGITPINPLISLSTSPLRANENDTLNFELLAPTGIGASSNVDFRVDIVAIPTDSDTTNNSGSVNNLTFHSRTSPTLYFTRLRYPPAGLSAPDLADVQAGTGDSFVQGIYPVNDGDPNVYREGLFPVLSFSTDAGTAGVIDGSDVNDLLSFLESCRQLIVALGLGANNSTFLYGWVRDNPINGNGWATVGGRVAFGNTQHIRHQRTYAHELGHNFGLRHNSRKINEVGWDVGARLDGNPATNNTTGRVKPTTLNDIMRGGQLTDSAWVDTTTYNFFLNHSVLGGTLPDAAPDTSQVVGPGLGGGEGPVILPGIQQPTPRVLVVQGVFDPQGATLRLAPTFRYPWSSQPTDPPLGSTFAVEVVDDEGNLIIVPFSALVADDSEKGPDTVTGPFSVMVAVSPDVEVASLRITDADGRQTFGSLDRSQPPLIEIFAPKEGQSLGKETEVAWEVSDPDTDRSDMLFQVAYSPDNGNTFVPIAVDVAGTENGIVFDATQVQRSDDTGLIRVFVSDGLNTAFADVVGLTVSQSQFP